MAAETNTFFGNLFTWIKEALLFLLESALTLIGWVFDTIIYILKGLAFLLLDGLMITLKAMIDAVDISAFALQFAAGYGLIPSQAAYFMGAIGFPQFVSIIAIAYGIRFALNLIPRVEILGNSVGFDKL